MHQEDSLDGTWNSRIQCIVYTTRLQVQPESEVPEESESDGDRSELSSLLFMLCRLATRGATVVAIRIEARHVWPITWGVRAPAVWHVREHVLCSGTKLVFQSPRALNIAPRDRLGHVAILNGVEIAQHLQKCVASSEQ